MTKDIILCILAAILGIWYLWDFYKLYWTGHGK